MMNQPTTGPQSDKDTMLYRQMAGAIGDPTVPASVKKAALATVREIHQHSGGQSDPLGVRGGDAMIRSACAPSSSQNVTMAQVKLSDIRAQFPMYADVPDPIAQGLFTKFYSDIPREQFLSAIEYDTSKQDPTADMSVGQSCCLASVRG